jgi:hypothetical protein
MAQVKVLVKAIYQSVPTLYVILDYVVLAAVLAAAAGRGQAKVLYKRL